jgi:ABC-type transporter Mla subunit MlaD
MTNTISFRRKQNRQPSTPRPSFGDQARAIVAMEAAAEILKPHEETIARMAREYADALHALDPKSEQVGHLFISAHMLIEDVKAFQDQENQKGIPS